jgi:hypothetical protein
MTKPLYALGLLALLSGCAATHRSGYEVYLANNNGKDLSIITCDSVQMQSKGEATIWSKGKAMKVYADCIMIAN